MKHKGTKTSWVVDSDQNWNTGYNLQRHYCIKDVGSFICDMIWSIEAKVIFLKIQIFTE